MCEQNKQEMAALYYYVLKKKESLSNISFLNSSRKDGYIELQATQLGLWKLKSI